MSIAIRPATAVDAEPILALQRLCYESEARLYDDWSIPPLTQTLAELQAEFASSVVLKASLAGRIVGSVRARAAGGCCQIGRLIVHPDFQRRGIGSQLMQEIERAFAAVDRFELFTGSRSEGNLRLYEALGYRRCLVREISPKLSFVYLEKYGAAAQRSE